TILGNHRLHSRLSDPLLPPSLADRRPRRFAAEERADALCGPRAALVVADAPGARREHRVARGVERLLGNEPDELVAQMFSSAAAARSVESPVFGVPSVSISRMCASSSARGQCSTPRGTT